MPFVSRENQEMLIGEKFHKLTILSLLNVEIWYGSRRLMALVICDCGSEFEHPISHIKSGKIKSCGCLHAESSKERRTHGLTNHPLYQVWATIKTRCYNKKHPNYKYWGARGVIVCEEWKNSFHSFYLWCINNGWKRGMQIDKDIIPSKLGIPATIYSPEMCQFVSNQENSNCRRSSVYVELDGVVMTKTDAARALKVSIPSFFSYSRVHGVQAAIEFFKNKVK